jgi:hypothetical protein
MAAHSALRRHVSIFTRWLRDGSTERDFDAPSADQFAVASRWVKNDRLFWRELLFAVVATDVFVHPALPTGELDGRRNGRGCYTPQRNHEGALRRALRNMFFSSCRAGIISYLRWPSPIPMCNAFWRRAPTERLVSFDILTTGVRAFE